MLLWTYELSLIRDGAEHMEPDEESGPSPLPEWVLLEYRHIVQQVLADHTSSGPERPTPARQRTESATSIKDIPESRVTFSHLSKSTSDSLSSLLPSAPSDGSDRSREPRVSCTILSVLDLMSTLRININSVCLLDPKAPSALSPADSGRFKWFLFGGILGDDPPRDRTGELRAYGFPGRHLGEVQMTTDTALAVTKRVVEEGVELDRLPYVDRPQLRYRKGETVEMPFRYLADAGGEPVMAEGMRDHIGKDLDRSFA